MPIKFLVLGGGGVFWVLGGWKCQFHFYGREDFSEKLLGVPKPGCFKPGCHVCDSYAEVRSFADLRMPLFLREGCFPADFREGKRPIKAFGETAH